MVWKMEEKMAGKMEGKIEERERRMRRKGRRRKREQDEVYAGSGELDAIWPLLEAGRLCGNTRTAIGTTSKKSVVEEWYY